ncbi:MAG: nucleotidyltransferase domain-containing protein [Candidatus Thermoplasmatota archaeon]
MAKKQDKVIEEIKKFLGRVKAEEGILFGSRARGDNLENSDVDLIIISDRFATQRYADRFYDLHKKWSLPYFLEAFPYTRKELKKLTMRGVIREALRNGIRIKVQKE